MVSIAPPARSLVAWLVTGGLLSAGVIGCGGDDASGDAGDPFTDASPAADAGAVPPGAPIVAFFFDDSLGALFRLSDHNDDGDLHDPGETVRFFDASVPASGLRSSPALLALGPRTILATDAESLIEPRDDNLVRLDDKDEDGDGFEPGEATIWFAGELPGGNQLTRPIAVAMDETGDAVYLADSNLADAASRFGIYRLEDANRDEVVTTAEVDLYLELNPSGQTSRVTSDIELAGGRMWLLEVGTDGDEVLFQVDPDTHVLVPALTSADLLQRHNLVIFGALSRLARLPGGELVFQAFRSPSGFATLVAVRDRDGDGAIDRGELRILWDEELHAGSPANFGARDLCGAADGSLLALVANQGTIHRFVDGNDDGDFDDAGEDRVIYDTAQSVATGGENTADLLSLSVAIE